MEPEVHYSDARVPCKVCGRSFAPEVLAKHSNICKKNAVTAQKRKQFDSSKQRVLDGELSLRQIKQAQKKDVSPPKNNWRAKHEDFINAIRNAKGVQQAIDRGGPLPPPPPPSINPDYIQCPYCSRRFNQQAAERHINFCKEQSSRLPRGRPDSNAAAKQNARLGYQPPKLKAKAPPGGSTGVAGTGRGTPPARGAPTARGGPAARGGVAPVRGRAAPTQDQYGSAGDSRGFGKGKQQQQRAYSFENQHQDSYSKKKYQQEHQARAHSFDQPQSQQHKQRNNNNSQRQGYQREQDNADDFYNSPQDFYTPFASPRQRPTDYMDGCSSNSNNKSSTNGVQRPSHHHLPLQDQHPKYSSRSNSSASPYQQAEDRSRRADGMPVRSRVSPDTHLRLLTKMEAEDDGMMGNAANIGSSPASSARRGHLQTTGAPFCYECGAKYPVSTAKFCCQCGVKRASCH